MTISKALKKSAKKKEPLWKGPEDNGELGGVTQSLLTDFLVDRERFRIRYIEGLRSPEKFDHKLEFGNLWHACEEAYAKGWDWKTALSDSATKLTKKFPMNRGDVLKWWNVVKVQFPVYVEYWKKNDTAKNLTPLLQEHVFHVPYTLPSGRTVWLKGKWDRVDLRKEGKESLIWLGEHKTKGDIDEILVQKRLRFDIQTMTYLISLWESPSCDIPRVGYYRCSNGKEYPIKGVNYNVIRRPLSGGKGTIRQHKPTKSNPRGESAEEFYNRLAKDYIIPEPSYWFMRWDVEVFPSDIENFKRKFLNPILEQLCDWYEWVTHAPNPYQNDYKIQLKTKADERLIDYSIHYQTPYIFHPILEGGYTELDSYIDSGNSVGLVRSETLFEELK